MIELTSFGLSRVFSLADSMDLKEVLLLEIDQSL